MLALSDSWLKIKTQRILVTKLRWFFYMRSFFLLDFCHFARIQFSHDFSWIIFVYLVSARWWTAASAWSWCIEKGVLVLFSVCCLIKDSLKWNLIKAHITACRIQAKQAVPVWLFQFTALDFIHLFGVTIIKQKNLERYRKYRTLFS